MSHLTEITQPGVTFNQQIIDISRREKPTALPIFIGYSARETLCNQLMEVGSLHEFNSLFGKDTGAGNLSGAMRLYFSHGGGRCYILALFKTPEELSATAQDYQGIQEIIASEPAITLMVLPDIVLLEKNEWQKVVEVAGKCCADSLNLFALIDFPSSPQAAEQYRQVDFGINARHMAGYWPWVVFEDDAAVRLRLAGSFATSIAVPSSAAVAAVLQTSDKSRGIWRAPANIRLEKVIKPEYDHQLFVTLFSPDPHSGCSVNQIRSFPGRGIKIWGCRTLSRQDDVSQLYVQNQRLLKWIKSTLSEAMRPYVYEQNNEITWYRLHALVRRRLKSLWESGGLAGATEEEAYQISVGLDDTMSGEDIQNGLLRCRVSVAIHQPLEFVHINLDFWLGINKEESRGILS